tara:strand:- start:241 stop:630 length:390 start_codon:yes stop_codon:yes gene_type:complete
LKLINDSELSGHLDGELDQKRAREVAATLAKDPLLRQEFTALSALDMQWKKAAQTVAFSPQKIMLPIRKSDISKSTFTFAVVAIAFTTVRLAPKLIAIEWGFALHGLALAAVLIWFARYLSEAEVAPQA